MVKITSKNLMDYEETLFTMKMYKFDFPLQIENTLIDMENFDEDDWEEHLSTVGKFKKFLRECFNEYIENTEV